MLKRIAKSRGPYHDWTHEGHGGFRVEKDRHVGGWWLLVTGGRGVVVVHGQLRFLRLTELLASEPDSEGGDSLASVTEEGGWMGVPGGPPPRYALCLQ